MNKLFRMRKLYYFLAFALLLGSVFLFDKDSCQSVKCDTEALLLQKQYPYDYFYFQRAFPDAHMDVKAYKKVMIETAEAMADARGSEFDVAWQNEGPNNIGGRINAVLSHPDDSDIIYVGNTTGGVFKTENGGTDWYPIFDDNPFLATSCITFDPDDPDILYVGTGDRNISGYPSIGNGVYKSSDAGVTWEHLGLSEQSIVSKIIVDPGDTQTIYAATMGLPFEKSNDRGLYKSTDGGLTWEQSLFIADSAGVIDLVMDPFDSQTLYAAGWNRIRNSFKSLVKGPDSRIFKTTDGGDSWTMLSNGLPMVDNSRPGLAISQQTPGLVFALFVGSDYNLHSIHNTTDAGNSWTQVGTTNLPYDYLGGFGWYFGQIRVNPEDDDELYVLGVDMYKTTSGGNSWFMSTPPWYFYQVHADKHDLFFVNENTLLLSTDGGLYKSDNAGDDWEDIEDIPNTQLYRVKVNHHKPEVYYGGTQDNGTIKGNNATQNSWNRVYGGDGFQPLFDLYFPTTFYAETQNGNLVATTDNGSDWFGFTDGISSGDPRSWDMPFARNEMNVYFTGTNKMYRNVNAPYGNWSPVSPILTSESNNRYYIISEIGTSRLNPDIVYAGTSDAFVWRSLDGGTTWDEITGDLPQRFVSAVRASPNYDKAVFVGHSGYKMNEYIPHIHRSEDHGDTWLDISGDLPAFAINDIEILWDNADSVVFVATDGGVYATLNGGQQWSRLGNNMPIVPVYDIEIDESSNRLIAGTHARSMMSFPIDSLVIVTGDKESKENKVLTIYPNPAINYFSLELPENIQDNAELSIYDLSGKMVLTTQLIGSKNRINVSSLQNGTYIVQLSEGEFVYNGRFVVAGK